MATPDDGRHPQRRPGLDRVRDSSSMLPLILGALAVLLLGWWLFSSPATNDVGTTRTSSPSTNAGPDANRVPNANNPPSKQQ